MDARPMRITFTPMSDSDFGGCIKVVTTPDPELLRQYLDDDANDALAELVRRYMNLVYSAALRQVGGDAHLAADVAQQVFIDFARKASQLRGRPALAGWLYTSTRFAAAKLVRSERRRLTRQMEALAMNEANAESAPSVDLRPVLDDAIHELSERDRETVVLRFFDQRPMADIGRVLGISENAASKAVERALERLRLAFAHRGIASTTAALSAAMAAQAVGAAPVAVTTTVTTAVLGTTGAAATTTILFMSKPIATVVVGSLALLAGGITVYQLHRRTQIEDELSALRAELVQERARVAETVKARTAAESELPALRTARAELIALKAQTAARPPAAAKPDVTPPVNPMPLEVVEKLTNVGRATPSAATTTYLWAMTQRDAATVAAMTEYNEPNLARLRQLFDELSPDARAALKTPEQMAAAALPAGTKPVERFEIVALEPRSADETLVRYRQNDDTTIRQLLVHQTSDGWKVAGRGKFFDDPEKREEVKFLAERAAKAATK
jgi:RNA polymerase sigma factor (sigma-70 family)